MKSYTQVFRAPIDLLSLPKAIQEVIDKEKDYVPDGIVHQYDHWPELWDTDRWQIIFKGLGIVIIVDVELGLKTHKVISERRMWFGNECLDIIKGVA